MLQQLESALAAQLGAPADIRWGHNRRTEITFRGPVLTDCRTYTTQGGHIRSFASGGKAFASNGTLDTLDGSLERSCRATATMARMHARPVMLTSTQPVTGTFVVPTARDPRGGSLWEDLDLLSHCNNRAPSVAGVVTTRAVARKDGLVQETAVTLDSSGDYRRLVDRDEAANGKVRGRLHDVMVAGSIYEHLPGVSASREIVSLQSCASPVIRVPELQVAHGG